jgi:zinc D-Ala-D-Ala dipeptidase
VRAALLVSLLPLIVHGQSGVIAINDADWVNLRQAAPNITIELRYATSHNVLGHRIYPTAMPPLLRAGVARRLIVAQTVLQRYRYGLKIWDAYRPRETQAELWKLFQHDDYVVDPARCSGSLHTWGVAVDATLVDDWGRSVAMPTDFDDFTPAAMLHYQGSDPLIRTHLYMLQKAMAFAGFYGLWTEWWHFTSSDWKKYVPAGSAKLQGTVALSP